MLPLGLLSLCLGGAQCLSAVVQGEPTVTERGPHHRVWSRQDVRTLPDGRAVTNVTSFVELGSGIHRWDAQASQYVDASDLIEIAADGSGAFGRNAAYQVHFSPNANTAGAITLITPDGKTLKSHALSLAWFDSATGRSELFASIKDSIGELHAPNIVIYPDAFDGEPGFRADIRYTYRLDGFSQDIVILNRPPDLPPGYAPDTTRMEVWTEFIEAPGATLTQQARAGMTDDTLNFGAMQTSAGRTFVLGDDTNPKRSATVAKKWLTAEGRTFLVEAVRYLSVKPELDKLPAPQGQAALKPRNANAQLAANVVGNRAFPPAPKARAKKPAEKFRTAAIGSPRPTDGRGVGSESGATKSATNAAVAHPSPLNEERTGVTSNSQLSTLSSPQRGFVIDYDLQAFVTNFIFQCDTTYYVSGTVFLIGTSTFEGGCVIKYAPTNGAKLQTSGDCVWLTSQYRPAIFTARDDHTVGTAIGTNALSGYYADTALFLDNDPIAPLQHLRVSHATAAIVCYFNYNVYHAQFVHCSQVLGASETTVDIGNILAFDIDTFISASATTISGAHLTVHQCRLFNNSFSSNTASLVNSLFIRQTNWGNIAKTLTSCFEGTDDSVFQTKGAAAHYLAAGSPHRNAGTTSSLSTGLLADLKKRTTYPPIIQTGWLTNDLTLAQQAQRDTDTPDLGYHYDPLDYVWASVIHSNATLTLGIGTAIGVAAPSTGYGLAQASGSHLVGTGSPTNLNRIVRYNTVQEQANTNWTGIGNLIAPSSYEGTSPNTARFAFTEWVALGGYHFSGWMVNTASVELTHCHLYGAYASIYGPILAATNCLFQRVGSYLDDAAYKQLDIAVCNSTFQGGAIWISHVLSGTWLFRDNFFVGTTITTNGENTSNIVTADHNAYTLDASRLIPTNATDVLLNTNTVAFYTGTLGSFYLPANGPATNLFNKGSTNANLLGLWHFTTTTNQVKETNSIVDIGFHYVATGANGLPVDTDGDGWPDYWEDANGNGSLDHRETKPNDPADWGLRVFITRPRNGSSIP